MRGERWALCAGEYLVGRASRRLPASVREVRHQEWPAELPVILHDSAAGSAPRRVARMLAFAADTLRGTTLRSGSYRYQGAHAGKAESLRDALLAIAFLLTVPPVLLAIQAYIVYQLIFGVHLYFGVGALMAGVGLPAIRWIRRRAVSADDRWFIVAQLVLGSGLIVRGLDYELGWGVPSLFVGISCCGYIAFLVCMGKGAAALVRLQQADPPA
jgi:hypothetical protein